MVITIDRSSVSMGDDMESHRGTLQIPPSITVRDFLREALNVCPLAYVGSQATWSILIVDQEGQRKRSVGVFAEQWSEPKLLVSVDETVASLFVDGAVGLFFSYLGQSDPEAAFRNLQDHHLVPPLFTATKTIKTEGKTVPVRQIALVEKYHCRVLEAEDGVTFLEYPVSVGP